MTDATNHEGSAPINWNTLMRQFHRWVSVVFTLSVIATFIALSQKEPLVWVSYVPLLPLALLFLSGTYMFVRPYIAAWRKR